MFEGANPSKGLGTMPFFSSTQTFKMAMHQRSQWLVLQQLLASKHAVGDCWCGTMMLCPSCRLTSHTTTTTTRRQRQRQRRQRWGWVELGWCRADIQLKCKVLRYSVRWVGVKFGVGWGCLPTRSNQMLRHSMSARGCGLMVQASAKGLKSLPAADFRRGLADVRTLGQIKMGKGRRATSR